MQVSFSWLTMRHDHWMQDALCNAHLSPSFGAASLLSLHGSFLDATNETLMRQPHHPGMYLDGGKATARQSSNIVVRAVWSSNLCTYRTFLSGGIRPSGSIRWQQIQRRGRWHLPFGRWFRPWNEQHEALVVSRRDAHLGKQSALLVLWTVQPSTAGNHRCIVSGHQMITSITTSGDRGNGYDNTLPSMSMDRGLTFFALQMSQPLRVEETTNRSIRGGARTKRK